MDAPVKYRGGDDEDAEEKELNAETDDGYYLACVHGADGAAGHDATTWKSWLEIARTWR